MLALSLSDTTTSGIIGGIVIIFIIAFVITGFLKGLARMTLGLIFLAAGMAAGQWGLWKGSSIAGTLVDEPDPWMSGAVAVILGLATFFVARALFGILLNPISSKEGKTRSLGAPGGVLGLLMGAAFAWFCLSGVRYVGSISELAWVREAVTNKEWLNSTGAGEEDPARPAQPLFSTFKRELDANIIGQFHEKYDFLNSRAQANLAKIAIIVENEQVATRAYRTGAVREAALQAEVNSLLKNQSSQLKALYDTGQYSQLLHSRLIKETCRSEEVQEHLTDLDIETAIGLLVAEPEENE